MKKYILGINLPIKARCLNPGVALIDFEAMLFLPPARKDFQKKIGWRFPWAINQKMLEFTGVKKEDVEYVVVPTIIMLAKFFRFAEFILKKDWRHLLKSSTYKVFINYFCRKRMFQK